MSLQEKYLFNFYSCIKKVIRKITQHNFHFQMSHLVEVQITHLMGAKLEEGHGQKAVALRTTTEVSIGDLGM